MLGLIKGKKSMLLKTLQHMSGDGRGWGSVDCVRTKYESECIVRKGLANGEIDSSGNQ
jgi:hypothetical protein